MKELTEEETLYYANYSLTDTCDLCGEDFAITNYHDGDEYLEHTIGCQLLCNKCNK